jgi:hypothetical protein
MLPLVVDAKLWNESALLAKRFPKKKFWLDYGSIVIKTRLLDFFISKSRSQLIETHEYHKLVCSTWAIIPLKLFFNRQNIDGKRNKKEMLYFSSLMRTQDFLATITCSCLQQVCGIGRRNSKDNYLV